MLQDGLIGIVGVECRLDALGFGRSASSSSSALKELD